MSFESLNRVLGSLQNQSEWQQHQQFQYLRRCWPEVVGPVVEAQTRPFAITQQQVLKVAASSSVWAQNLAFERQRILDKLNAKLLQPLVDIRFSTTQWHSPPQPQPSFKQLQQSHPSQLPQEATSAIAPVIKSAGPNLAFTRWANQIQARSRSLPLCPQCQCPTPPGELQRWAICSLCVTKQWK